MKKIIISIGTLVLLWMVSTVLIGSQHKEVLEQYITTTNKLNKEKGIQLTLKSYEKRFFESVATLEVDVLDPSVQALLKESVVFPISMEYTIEHGPVFFKHGLGFGLSKSHHELDISSLLKPEAKEEFLSIVPKDVHIKSDVHVSLLKNLHYSIRSNEINVDKKGEKMFISPFVIEGLSHIETFKGEGTFKLKKFSFQKEKNSNGLEIENLLLEVELEELIANQLFLGNINFSFDTLKIKDDNAPLLGDLNIASRFKLNNEKSSDSLMNSSLEGDIDCKDSKFPPHFLPLKTLHLNTSIDNFGIDGMLKFQKAGQEMQKAQTKVIAKIQESQTPDFQAIFLELGRIQNRMLEKTIEALNTFLIKDKTEITYILDLQTKDSNESKAEIEALYTADIVFEGSAEALTLKLQQHLLDIANLDVKLALDKEHLKYFPKNKELTSQIEMALQQGFLKEKNEKYILNAYYKNHELMVNDNNLTATLLPFLLMMTSQKK